MFRLGCTRNGSDMASYFCYVSCKKSICIYSNSNVLIGLQWLGVPDVGKHESTITINIMFKIMIATDFPSLIFNQIQLSPITITWVDVEMFSLLPFIEMVHMVKKPILIFFLNTLH